MQEMFREAYPWITRETSAIGAYSCRTTSTTKNLIPCAAIALRLTISASDSKTALFHELGWDGEGCAISQASASMFGEELLGLALEDARQINKQQLLQDSIGLRLSINRVKCALLPLKVLVVGAYGKAGSRALGIDRRRKKWRCLSG